MSRLLALALVLLVQGAALAGCVGAREPLVPPGASLATGAEQRAEGAPSGADDEPLATFGQISWHPREPRADQTLRVRVWVDGALHGLPRCLPVVSESPGGGGGIASSGTIVLETDRYFECEIVPVKHTDFFAFSVIARDRSGGWFLSDFFVVPTLDERGARAPGSTIAGVEVTARPGDSVRASVTVEPAAFANPGDTTNGVARFVRLPFDFNGIIRHGARLAFDELGRLAGEAPWVEPNAPESSGMYLTDGVIIGVATTRNASGGTAVSERVVVPFGACVQEECVRV